MTDRLLRVPEVLNRTGFARTTLYRKINAGDFPRPVEAGSNMVGFLESEVAVWIDSRPRRTSGEGT